MARVSWPGPHERIMWVITVIVGLYFIVELISSHVTHSLVLLMNAYQASYNLLGMVLIVVSHHASQEKTINNTFGWVRIEVLGTLVNTLFLLALCFATFVAAVQTIVHAAHENTTPQYPLLMMSCAIVGIVLDIARYLVIGAANERQGDREYNVRVGTHVQVNLVESRPNLHDISTSSSDCDQVRRRIPSAESTKKVDDVDLAKKPISSCNKRCDHVESVVMELLRTSGCCMLVLVCALVLKFSDGDFLKYIDSILALVSVAILVWTSIPHIKMSGLVLLQTVPDEIDLDDLQAKLRKEFPMIQDVHEMHVWSLSDTKVIGTCHVTFNSPDDYRACAYDLDAFFVRNGISSVTAQPEFCACELQGADFAHCHLQCSAQESCKPLTCCGGQEEIHEVTSATTPKSAARLQHSHSHSHHHHHIHHAKQQSSSEQQQSSSEQQQSPSEQQQQQPAAVTTTPIVADAAS